MSSDQIKASSEMLRLLARLRRVVDPMPAVFPTAASPSVRPLAIGAGRMLHEFAVPPEGMPSAKAHAIIADVLRRYTGSPEYRQALAAPAAWRHDLDGNPTEPVSPEHAIAATESAPVASTQPEKIIFDMKVPGLKVALPLSSSLMPRNVSETTKMVEWKLDLGDGSVIAVSFSGKNYRRALRTLEEIEQSGGEAIVLMQGKLVAGRKIEGAGLSVQVKAKRED
jgi:hypothetical protein